MFTIFLIFHVILAIMLVVLILIQQGKGADAGAAFGSGAAGSVFGPRGATTFLNKITTSIAIGFFVSSLLLAYLASQPTPEVDSLMQSTIDQLALPDVATTTQTNSLPDDIPTR